MTDWHLSNTWSHGQVAFIATIGAFCFIILALWRTPVLLPFKLITVFLHEASHATACKLTCGKVEGMEVNVNEGGVTHTRGGKQWFILPAGYLGSSFWGMVLIVASTNGLTLRIAAGLLIAALVVVLVIAKNWFLRFLCLGVMNCLFSIYDIYDDLISRRVNSSDAEKFAQICPCPCNGVMWGVVWGFISVIFLAAAVYLGLVSLSS